MRLCCLHHCDDARHYGKDGEDGENGNGGTAQPSLPALLTEILTRELRFLLALHGRGRDR